jgi:hypothetical protein
VKNLYHIQIKKSITYLFFGSKKESQSILTSSPAASLFRLLKQKTSLPRIWSEKNQRPE